MFIELCKFMIIMKTCFEDQRNYSNGSVSLSVPSLQLRWATEGNRHNNSKDKKNGGSIDNGWENWDDINPLTQKAHFYR